MQQQLTLRSMSRSTCWRGARGGRAERGGRNGEVWAHYAALEGTLCSHTSHAARPAAILAVIAGLFSCHTCLVHTPSPTCTRLSPLPREELLAPSSMPGKGRCGGALCCQLHTRHSPRSTSNRAQSKVCARKLHVTWQLHTMQCGMRAPTLRPPRAARSPRGYAPR
jgi:hypothetical protein